MELTKRHFIKSSNEREIREKLSQSFGEEAASLLFPEEADLEVASLDDFKVILVDGSVTLFMTDNGFMPLTNGLKSIEKDARRRADHKVVVDEGAVEFILDGADIMAPGIVSADESIEVGDMVFVIDEEYSEPLAIGKAIVDGEDMAKLESGKSVESIHHAGDDLWKHAR